jgi:integrase
MGKSLTIKALENLKPGAARREVPDGLLPGFYFIMQPTGKASWACRYRHGGQSRKLTLGPYPAIDLKRARDLARAALAKAAEGADPAAEKQASRRASRVPNDHDLIEKVVPLFVARYARPNQREETAYETERVLNREVVSRWKGRRLSAIGKADIHELLDSIMDRGSPIQANRTLAAFRRLCGWAVERGLISTSPCAGIRAPAAETSRDRVLTDDELQAVWQGAEAISWPFGAIVRMLILTGQRRGEVAGMRRQELDLDAKTWTLPKERCKNGVEHVVPLSSAAIELLGSLPRIAGELVFSFNGRAVPDGFDRAKKRIDAYIAGRNGKPIPAWRLHDLRRTFASGCARLGVQLPVVEKLLNHTSGSFRGVAGVYQRHDFAGEQRAAVETWARHVEALVSGGAAGNVVLLKRGAQA